jgi:DNA-directed RNA polymerase sigma subunit (sigma70/sigma32)
MASQLDATECAALMSEAERTLAHLSPLEEFVLRRRFGLGGRVQTPEVIARGLGLRREDVQRIESRALGHLRRAALAPNREEGVGDWGLGAGS